MGKSAGQKSKIKTRKPTAPPAKVFADKSKAPFRKQKYKKRPEEAS
jgi:hypothetical protein